jgi:CheY-like chemotaxis protein
LLDLQMPVMDGWDVGRRLRDTGKRDLPIVLLTSQDQVRDSYEDVQAAHVLAKPFDMDELLSVVSHYCQPTKPPEEEPVAVKAETPSFTVAVLLITLAFVLLRMQPFRPSTSNAVVELWHSVLFIYRVSALLFRGAFAVVNACNALLSARAA